MSIPIDEQRNIVVDELLALLQGRKIIIYGASKIGRRLHAALEWFGFPVDRFWDQRAVDLGGALYGTPIQLPDYRPLLEEDLKQYAIIVAIFAENVRREIKYNLEQLGYDVVIDDLGFITKLLHAECATRRSEDCFAFNLETCHICPVITDTRNRCNIFDDHVRKNFAKDIPQFPRLIVPSAGILISNKCTLTCIGCNHLRDHYLPSDHIDIPAEQILADLQKFVSAIDMINKLVLVGGEALMHPEITDILTGIIDLPRVGVIHIITNGTVIPKSNRLFELMASPRIIVEISGYGDHIPAKFQHNVKKFLGKLCDYGIHHHYAKTLQWFDFGSFEDRGYGQDAWRRTYETCCFVSNDIFDGRLYKCSRSAYGTLIGKVPDYPGDYVDLRQPSIGELRERIGAFLDLSTPRVCRHCNGTSTQVIEAGKQLKFVRKSSQDSPSTERATTL